MSRSIRDGIVHLPVPKENLANPGNSWRCLSSTLLMISCNRLQTPDSFGNSSCQSVCSAVLAYYLYKCSLMHGSLISCSFKEQIHSFPGQFRCQFFCSAEGGGYVPVPNPSWLSTLWKGSVPCWILAWQAHMFSLQFSGFVEDPESRRSHGSVGEVIDLLLAGLEQFSCLKTWVWD